nr:VOC family protein [Pandoraea fibrosis]
MRLWLTLGCRYAGCGTTLQTQFPECRCHAARRPRWRQPPLRCPGDRDDSGHAGLHSRRRVDGTRDPCGHRSRRVSELRRASHTPLLRRRHGLRARWRTDRHEPTVGQTLSAGELSDRPGRGAGVFPLRRAGAERSSDTPATQIHHVALRVRDLEALERWKSRLTAHDVPFALERHGEAEHLYLLDPNEIMLELCVQTPESAAGQLHGAHDILQRWVDGVR